MKHKQFQAGIAAEYIVHLPFPPLAFYCLWLKNCLLFCIPANNNTYLHMYKSVTSLDYLEHEVSY